MNGARNHKYVGNIGVYVFRTSEALRSSEEMIMMDLSHRTVSKG